MQVLGAECCCAVFLEWMTSPWVAVAARRPRRVAGLTPAVLAFSGGPQENLPLRLFLFGGSGNLLGRAWPLPHSILTCSYHHIIFASFGVTLGPLLFVRSYLFMKEVIYLWKKRDLHLPVHSPNDLSCQG